MRTNQLQKNTKWVEKELGEVASFFNGKAHENDISDNGKYIVINSKFVSTNGRVAKYTNECFSPLKKGDVAMVMSDIPNGKAIAKCFLVDGDNKYTLNQRIGGFRSKEINSSFLYFLLNRNRYFLAFDDGVNQTNLRKDDILECPLYFPSLPEQKRIVSVFETWDKSIENLNKKIEIKKQIKKGLMQDLLTGKKRLSNFKDKWKIDSLDMLFNISSGGGKIILEKNQGKYFIVEMGSVTEDSKLITNKKTDDDDVVFLHTGDLIMPTRDIGEGRIIGKVAIIDKNDSYVLGNNLYRLTVKNKLINSRFFYYLINSHNVNNALKKKVAKSVQLALNKNCVEEQRVLFPVKKEEQDAITNILNTADKEITKLENKLLIIKDQKKYLLNNLITGVIRTPENLKVN